jgi:hypothetical protein
MRRHTCWAGPFAVLLQIDKIVRSAPTTQAQGMTRSAFVSDTQKGRHVEANAERAELYPRRECMGSL